MHIMHVIDILQQIYFLLNRILLCRIFQLFSPDNNNPAGNKED